MNNIKLLLKESNYMKLFVSSLICRFADSLDVLVYSWMTYIVTGKATYTAIVYAANQIPTVVIQPFAGVFVEKLDKKRVYMITNGLRALIVLLILVVLSVGKLSLVHLVLSTFLFRRLKLLILQLLQP